MSYYPGFIHPREFSGENLVRKITPRWKAFGFFTSRKLLHNFLYPGKNTESLLIFELLPDELWYYSETLLNSWCVAAPCRNHSNPRQLFSWNIRLNFLVMIDFFLFYKHFVASWELDVIYLKKKINQNSFDEEYPFYNLGIARLSYAVTLQDGRTQW